MADSLFEIRVNSTELNKDKGFEVLVKSGLSIMCLEDEKYIITNKGIELLKRERVLYEVISINGSDILSTLKYGASYIIGS